MSKPANHIKEQEATEAFSRQSFVFDFIYGADSFIQYKRKRVRSHLLSAIRPFSTILELNCGTGEDALYLASKGFKVHATDASENMLSRLQEKLSHSPFAANISFENCSFSELAELKNRGPYDLVFSNFGGLNCTGRIDKVLTSIDPLLKPGGKICIVVISNFSLWELLLVFKGRFKTAFRRFFAKNGRNARVESIQFKCWYYPSSTIKKHLPGYRVVKEEGLCTILPPSYIENFPGKYPGLFKFLRKWEEKLASNWPWRVMGDYFILTLQKNDQTC